MEQIPDSITPLTGIRLWRLSAGHVVPDDASWKEFCLRAVGFDSSWHWQEPTAAVCERCAGEAPEPGCSCGLYALVPGQFGPIAHYMLPSSKFWRRTVLPDVERELLPLIVSLQTASARYGVVEDPRVFGLVDLWGKVIEAEQGYRASLARPRAFLVPESYQAYGPGGAPVNAAEAAALLETRSGRPARVVPFASLEAELGLLAAGI